MAKKKTQKKDNTNMYVGILVGLIIVLVVLVYVYKGDQPQEEAVPAGVVARVNGIDITETELNTVQARLIQAYGPTVTRDAVLNQTIARVLLMEEAAKKGYEATPEDVEKAEALIVAQLPPGTTLEQVLELQNMTLEEARTELQNQVVLDKYFNGDLATDEKALAWYQENIADYTAKEGEIRARHILVETEEEALEILDKLNKGEDFVDLAGEYSISGDKTFGGELGFFTNKTMVEPFSKAAFALDVGEVSEPVESQFGFHIIERRPDVIPFEEVNATVKRQMIIELLPEVIKQLKKTATIEIFDVAHVAQQKPEETSVVLPDEQPEMNPVETEKTERVVGSTFKEIGSEICTVDDKPIVVMFSTTTCPHCNWVRETFDSVAAEYDAKGEIAAFHYDLNTGDNTLTEAVEEFVPQNMRELFSQANPQSTVPTFVFGCKYVRIGNFFERAENGLVQEEAEFRAVIDKLLTE